VSSADDAVAAIRESRLVVLPTDTVYGLVCAPEREAVAALTELKGRPPSQPLSLLAAAVDVLLECVPELRGRSESVARRLLPGAYTLVLPNPARRYDWLTGERAESIGVRVPVLEGPAREVVERAGAVASTSANLHGGPDPRTLEEVPPEIRSAVAAAIDAGELPGQPSTVVDLVGPFPRVLREGAVSADEALAAVADSLDG
jgi:L-threonylcarbamoyladenylate synthase